MEDRHHPVTGSDLLAGSRVAVRFPPDAQPAENVTSAACWYSVTASDGTVTCGTVSLSSISFKEVCSAAPPSFVTYSGTTGKRLRVLYRYHGQCLSAQAVPVWTDPVGRHVITLLLLAEKGVQASASDKFGLVADGRFTPLPALVVPRGAVDNGGGIAF